MKAHPPVTLMLCEGKDDMLVMESLAQHAGLAQQLKFESYDGESKLRAFLANLKVSPEYARGEYKKILVTRDADRDYAAAWQSVKDSIQSIFSAAITNPGEWTTLEFGVRIAAWIIPGPGQAGMIETLCLDAVRAKTPEMFACLDPFVECLSSQWGDAPHEKIRFVLWTIIAQGQGAQDRLSIDRAIRNIDFNWDDSAYVRLKELFQEISQ
jgi:hypothetical protein